jgi:hypothetical protein
MMITKVVDEVMMRKIIMGWIMMILIIIVILILIVKKRMMSSLRAGIIVGIRIIKKIKKNFELDLYIINVIKLMFFII